MSLQRGKTRWTLAALAALVLSASPELAWAQRLGNSAAGRPTGGGFSGRPSGGGGFSGRSFGGGSIGGGNSGRSTGGGRVGTINDTATNRLGQSAPGIPTGPRLGQSVPGRPTGPRITNDLERPRPNPRPNGNQIINDISNALNRIPTNNGNNNNNNWRPNNNNNWRPNDYPSWQPTRPTYPTEPWTRPAPGNSYPPDPGPSYTPRREPAVRANEVEIATECAPNDAGATGFYLDQPMLDSAVEDLDRVRDDQLAATGDELADGGLRMDQSAADAIRMDPAYVNATGPQQRAIDDAIAAGDPAATREAMRQAMFTDDQANAAATRVEGSNLFNDYRQTQQDPNSTQAQRDAAADALRDFVNNNSSTIPGNATQQQAAVDRINAGLNQQANIRNVRDQLTSLDLSGNGGLSGGLNSTVTVISWPDLEPGEVIVASSDLVLVGTDGQMRVGTQDVDRLGAGLVPGRPLPATDPEAVTTSGIVLMNPETSRNTIHYTVDGEEFSLEPGYVQALPAGRGYQVAFDRGNRGGEASYNLETEGTYEFGTGKKGWDLWQVTYKVKIDNSANKKDFHFVFANEQMTVRAKKGLELTSDYPLVLRFDQGKDGKVATRKLTQGTYRVGVTPQGLDLFAPSRTGQAAAAQDRNGNRPAPRPARRDSSRQDS